MAVITMSVAEWCAVPENPEQRDTARRARNAARNHLKHPSPLHRYVYACTKDGMVLCKLDGHTRAYLWERDVIAQPADGKVEVMCVAAKNMAEAAQFYRHLDNAKARKQPHDEIFGILRRRKVQLVSSLLYRCSFSNQLKMADHGSCKGGSKDIEPSVLRWIPQLKQLDELGLSRTYSTLIGLMLCTLKVDGPDVAGEFWKAVDSDSGTKTTAGMDGIEAVVRHCAVRKAEGRTSGWENLDGMFRQCLTAYMAWKQGKRVKLLRATDPQEFMRQVQEAKQCQ